MKKMVYMNPGSIYILDPKDYIKIEKDGQHVNDKYVYENGDKINEDDPLEKGQLIIRKFYGITIHPFLPDGFVSFKKFKHYKLYDDEEANKIIRSLNTRNSVFFNIKFNDVKTRIVDIFSSEIEIDI